MVMIEMIVRMGRKGIIRIVIVVTVFMTVTMAELIMIAIVINEIIVI